MLGILSSPTTENAAVAAMTYQFYSHAFMAEEMYTMYRIVFCYLNNLWLTECFWGLSLLQFDLLKIILSKTTFYQINLLCIIFKIYSVIMNYFYKTCIKLSSLCWLHLYMPRIHVQYALSRNKHVILSNISISPKTQTIWFHHEHNITPPPP